MKHKTVYSKEQLGLADALFFVHDGYYHIANLLEKYPPIPLVTILRKCAEAWGISEDMLKGKINHNKEFDKISKYCFLFGCELFNAQSTKLEEEELVGYTRHRGRRHPEDVGRQLKYRNKYAVRILLFIQSLIDSVPDNRIDQMVEKLKFRDQQRQKKEQENRLPTVQDYIDDRRNDTTTQNRFTPVWQSGRLLRARSIFDRMTNSNKYEFWERNKKTDYSWIVEGFEDDAELFFKHHRN